MTDPSTQPTTAPETTGPGAVSVEFEPWPKIARLNRSVTVTEKIDGTNAAVIITEDGRVAAQSRTRLITPANDNYGFARWAAEHADDLASLLGPGRHFGEWWGQGIQRGYGLAGKRFSLFNTKRYGAIESPLVSTVPVLYEGPFAEGRINEQLTRLRVLGSVAAPGFMRPEGIVVFHQAAQQMFKITIEGDEAPKSLVEGVVAADYSGPVQA